MLGMAGLRGVTESMAHPLSQNRPQASIALASAGVLFASVCFGLVPWFTRGLTDQGLAPHAVAFYRYVLAALVLSPTLIPQLGAWREIVWGLVAGVLMGLGWIGYVTALKTVPASTVGVLYMTYPVFTVGLAWMLFGDVPTRRAIAATGLIVIAAIIAGSPASVPTAQIPFLLISLTAPLGFGFGIVVLVHRLSRIPPLARMAAISLGSVLGLAPLVLASSPAEVIPRGSDIWLLVAGFALVTALVPQLIYTICSPLVGASRSAVMGSIELPTMVAVGVFAFGEHLTLAQAIACALVIAAILLTRSRATRNVATTIAKT